MNNSAKVDAFFAKLQHPLKAEMQAVRDIIRNASAKIEEDVKWGGPSFDYKEPFATFNPRITDCVAIIFHQGELLKDSSGLLEPGPKGRAYAKFRSMQEIDKNRKTLSKLTKDWVKLMG
jgi:hypothetical protein